MRDRVRQIFACDLRSLTQNFYLFGVYGQCIVPSDQQSRSEQTEEEGLGAAEHQTRGERNALARGVERERVVVEQIYNTPQYIKHHSYKTSAVYLRPTYEKVDPEGLL